MSDDGCVTILNTEQDTTVIQERSDEILVVEEENITYLIEQDPITILDIADPEIIVIRDPTGPPGPPGPPGTGGQQEVFVQATAPVVIPARDHIWIQTGLGPGGTGFLAQFMDGA